MAFRLFTYPKRRNDAPELVGETLRGRRKKARRAKHALTVDPLSGFQDTDITRDTDLGSTLGVVTPLRRGQD